MCGRRVGFGLRAAIPGTKSDSCMRNNSPEAWRRAMQAAEGRRADAMVLGFFGGSVLVAGRCCCLWQGLLCADGQEAK